MLSSSTAAGHRAGAQLADHQRERLREPGQPGPALRRGRGPRGLPVPAHRPAGARILPAAPSPHGSDRKVNEPGNPAPSTPCCSSWRLPQEEGRVPLQEPGLRHAEPPGLRPGMRKACPPCADVALRCQEFSGAIPPLPPRSGPPDPCPGVGHQFASRRSASSKQRRHLLALRLAVALAQKCRYAQGQGHLGQIGVLLVRGQEIRTATPSQILQQLRRLRDPGFALRHVPLLGLQRVVWLRDADGLMHHVSGP